MEVENKPKKSSWLKTGSYTTIALLFVFMFGYAQVSKYDAEQCNAGYGILLTKYLDLQNTFETPEIDPEIPTITGFTPGVTQDLYPDPNP